MQTPPTSSGTTSQLDLSRIAQDLQIRRVQVEAVASMLEEGNTVPFIARYRKERTGNLGEDILRHIQNRIEQVRQLVERKQTVLKSIENQGKLTEELRTAIQAADSLKRLEDLYLPYKPKKRTLATEAREKGLELLALAIWNSDPVVENLDEFLPTLIDPDKELHSTEDVLQGVQHILAEMISESADVRAGVRAVMWDTGRLKAKRNEKLAEKQGIEYKTYFDFSEGIRHIPPHRILAINRGEKEHALQINIEWDVPVSKRVVLERLPLPLSGDAPPDPLAKLFQPSESEPTPSAPVSEQPNEPTASSEASSGPESPQADTTPPEQEQNALQVAELEPVSDQSPQQATDPGEEAEQVSAPEQASEQQSEGEVSASAENASTELSGEPEAQGTPSESAEDSGVDTSDEKPSERKPTPPKRMSHARMMRELIARRTKALQDHPHVGFLEHVAEDALTRLIAPSLEREIRKELTARSEEHAIDVFARNLRGKLLAPPLRGRRVLGLDPGFRSGCKVAVLDENGELLVETVIYPHPPQRRRREAIHKLEELVRQHQVHVIAVGNGTACRETEEVVATLLTDFEADRKGEPRPTVLAEQKAEAERKEAEKREAEKQAAAKAEAERKEAEKLAAGKQEAEKQEAANEKTESTTEGESAAPESATPPSSDTSTTEPSSPETPSEQPTTEATVDTPPNAPLEPTPSAAEPTEPPAEPITSSEETPKSEPTTSSEETPKSEEGQSVETPAQVENSPSDSPKPSEGESAVVTESESNESKPEESKPTQGAKPKGSKRRSKNKKQKPLRDLSSLPQPLPELAYVVVNEAGASVYSASPIGREEFPQLDVAARGTISIARRLQDPLAELVKIDPHHVGVGLYQHDMAPKQMRASLENVIESCVNSVGVDLNSASVPLLRHVSGMNQLVARDLVEYRKAGGVFQTREDLKKVPGIGDARYVQAVGFLRIPEGEHPFDNTWIHPESYEVATKLLEELEFVPNDLRNEERLEALRAKLQTVELEPTAQRLGVGTLTLQDILESLARPGRDPREDLPLPIFKKGILQLEDLQPGMELKGTVLNVVDFGAFVDVGLKDSGLVHISQLANRFVKNPYDIVTVGDLVTVWVKSVDTDRHHVSLTMVQPGTERKPPKKRHPSDQQRQEPRERREGQEGERGPRRPPARRGPSQGREGERQAQGQGGGRGRPPRGRAESPPGALPARGTRRSTAQERGGRRPPPRKAEEGAQTGARQEAPPPRRKRRQPPKPHLSDSALAGEAPLGTFAELAAFWNAQDSEGEKPGKADTKDEKESNEKKDESDSKEN